MKANEREQQAVKPRKFTFPDQNDISGWVGPKLSQEEHEAAIAADQEVDRALAERAAAERATR